MVFRFTILLCTVVFCSLRVFGQYPCSTDERYLELLKSYPQLADFERQFNEQLRLKIAQRKTASTDTTIYDVPIVVHVIHDYGSENIADNIIYDAASYWATVYMEQNSDTVDVITPFKPYIGNPRMRLHLATKDPNGKPTKGVVRFQTYLTNGADDGSKMGQWDPTMYVNIWFISSFGSASAGAAAYAYFPSMATFMPYYDGIICLSTYCNMDKTVPHEMGHVMNLYHTWGGTNSAGVGCGDDEVDDTPPTKGHAPSGCTGGALFDTVCAKGYMVHYTSVSGGDSLVDYPDTTNAQNIMDYTYCERMFTKGQAERMRTALTSPMAGRNNLYSPTNLAATGALSPSPDLPPTADFIVDRATGGLSATDKRNYFLTFNNAASFVFRNTSWNDTVQNVIWNFSNAATVPTSASMGSVTNKFSTPGWVSVQLIANSNAGSDTLIVPKAVFAADTTTISPDGYVQSFGNDTEIANWWPMFNYYNNQFKWEYYPGAGFDDGACIRYHSYDTTNRLTGSAVGDWDDFFTPAFNLSGITGNYYLNFFTAGAATLHNISTGTVRVYDSLEIDASTSGGTRWTKIGGIGGTNLANNGLYGPDYLATGTTWKGRAISIPVSFRTGQTFFRFRYHPGNIGNNLYLDNLYFYPYPAGVKEAITNSVNSFSLYPNPSSTGCTLVFNSGSESDVVIRIRDLTGKLVYGDVKQVIPNRLEQIELPHSVTPVAGMYFVTLTIDGMSTVQKLVVY